MSLRSNLYNDKNTGEVVSFVYWTGTGGLWRDRGLDETWTERTFILQFPTQMFHIFPPWSRNNEWLRDYCVLLLTIQYGHKSFDTRHSTIVYKTLFFCFLFLFTSSVGTVLREGARLSKLFVSQFVSILQKKGRLINQKVPGFTKHLEVLPL